jgi:hypothetical protein
MMNQGGFNFGGQGGFRGSRQGHIIYLWIYAPTLNDAPFQLLVSSKLNQGLSFYAPPPIHGFSKLPECAVAPPVAQWTRDDVRHSFADSEFAALVRQIDCDGVALMAICKRKADFERSVADLKLPWGFLHRFYARIDQLSEIREFVLDVDADEVPSSNSKVQISDFLEHRLERVSLCTVQNDPATGLMQQFDLLNATLLFDCSALTGMISGSKRFVFTSRSVVAHRLPQGSGTGFLHHLPVESHLLQSGSAPGRTVKWDLVEPGNYTLAKHMLYSRSSRLVARELFLIRRFRQTILSQFDVHLLMYLVSFMVELDLDSTIRLPQESREDILRKRLLRSGGGVTEGFRFTPTSAGEFVVLREFPFEYK